MRIIDPVVGAATAIETIVVGVGDEGVVAGTAGGILNIGIGVACRKITGDSTAAGAVEEIDDLRHRRVRIADPIAPAAAVEIVGHRTGDEQVVSGAAGYIPNVGI